MASGGAARPRSAGARSQRAEGLALPSAKSSVTAPPRAVAAAAAMGAVINGHGASAFLNARSLTGMACATFVPVAPLQAANPTAMRDLLLTIR